MILLDTYTSRRAVTPIVGVMRRCLSEIAQVAHAANEG